MKGVRLAFTQCFASYCGRVGPDFGPLPKEVAALPLSMGSLGVTKEADILPYAFLASVYQIHTEEQKSMREDMLFLSPYVGQKSISSRMLRGRICSSG
jgi:hypothetical protein